MKIAFVCNGNSFKSIVAERFGNEFNDGTFEIYSAGTNPAEVINEVGKKIMEKRGLSMDGYSPKSMDTLPEKVDVLVKMGCNIECPIHHADRVLDFGLQDMTNQEEVVEVLGEKVGALLNTLKIGILADAEAKAKKLLEETQDVDCWGNVIDNSRLELKEEKKIKTPKEKKMYEYICYCDKVTKGDIVTAVIGGAKTLKDVMAVTGAMEHSDCAKNNPSGKCCGNDILEVIEMYS